MFWEYGRKADYLYPREPGARSPNLAIRDGDWKLLINDDGTSAQLFNLAADAEETNNLAAQHPEKVSQLSAAVMSWRRALP